MKQHKIADEMLVRQFYRVVEKARRIENCLDTSEEEKVQKHFSDQAGKLGNDNSVIVSAAKNTMLTKEEYLLLQELCPVCVPQCCITPLDISSMTYTTCSSLGNCQREEHPYDGCRHHSSLSFDYLTPKGNLRKDAFELLLSRPSIKLHFGKRAKKEYLKDLWERLKKKMHMVIVPFEGRMEVLKGGYSWKRDRSQACK